MNYLDYSTPQVVIEIVRITIEISLKPSYTGLLIIIIIIIYLCINIEITSNGLVTFSQTFEYCERNHCHRVDNYRWATAWRHLKRIVLTVRIGLTIVELSRVKFYPN